MNEKAFGHAAKQANEDVLGVNRQAAGRVEFPGGGKMLPKDGSNRWHNLIASNVAIAVGSRIHGNKSEIYVNGMRVKLKNNYICFPDVVIVSGEPAFGDANSELLLNPTVIVEIISNSTNPTAKSQKLESFLAMDSIKECLVLKADEMRVEHYAKQNPKQWIYKIYNERDDVISLDSVNCKMSLAEVYSQINIRQAELSSKAVN
jgi:Uma2 family endonuclease